MKLNLSRIALGVTFLTYASASPLRVIVVTHQEKVASPFRLGHAAANAVPEPNLIRVSAMSTTPVQQHGPCMGNKIRTKALEISNMFRQALGLPLIETHHKMITAEPAAEQVTHGGLIRLIPIKTINVGAVNPVIAGDRQATPVFGKKHHGHHHHHKSFLVRMTAALMALGPWEGRAVAFVLGCGIGVLLRMFWVMSLLTYRLMKNRPEQETSYIVIPESSDILVPPPHYIDEKVDLALTNEHS
jgi:hypothetical protein